MNTDDLDRYIAERDEREPGFARKVEERMKEKDGPRIQFILDCPNAPSRTGSPPEPDPKGYCGVPNVLVVDRAPKGLLPVRCWRCDTRLEG